MIETVISSSVLIAIIAILRLFLKGKVKNNVIYSLWLIAAIRLMIPFEMPESSFSLMNLRNNDKISTAENINFTSENQPNGIITADTNYTAESKSQYIPNDNTYQNRKLQHETDKQKNIIFYIWFFGFAAITIWFATVNLKFYFYLKKHRKKVRLKCSLPVYMVRKLDSPCLFGIAAPAIYINDASIAEKKNLYYIISHELTHYKHGDIFWSFLRSLLTAVYWFDPFVWLGAYLSKQDCECACDESVIKHLNLDNRLEYGRTLLSLVNSKHTNQLMNISTSMASGKKHLKERIIFIGKKTENSILVMLALMLLLTALACCTFTSALKAQSASDETPQASESLNPSKSKETKTNVITTDISASITTTANSKFEFLHKESSNILTISTNDTVPIESETEAYTEAHTENNSDEKTSENNTSEQDWNVFGKEIYLNARSLFFKMLVNGTYFEENGESIQDGYGIDLYQISDPRADEIEDIKNIVREAFTESLAAEYDSRIESIYTESDGILYQKHMGKGGVYSEEDIELEVISADESYAVFSVKKYQPFTQRTGNYSEDRFAITKENGCWKICEFNY